MKTKQPINWKQGDEEKIYEWKLEIPKAFIVDVIGESENIHHSDSIKNQHYSISIYGVLKEDMSGINPVPLGEKKIKDENIFIRIVNHRTGRWIAESDACIPGHRVQETADKLGVHLRKSAIWNNRCDEHVKFCRISMDLDGWAVGASVTKSMIEKPNLVCRTIKTFLNKHTIKRDGLDANLNE